MTKFPALINISAGLMLIAATGAAMAKPVTPSPQPYANDDFKPPVFAFAPVTETRALTVTEEPGEGWLIPHQPGPTDLHEK